MEVILEKKPKKCYVERDILREKLEQTREIAKQSELMIVVGAKKGTTTNQLYDAAIWQCNNAMIVEIMEDLYLNYISRFKKVGLIAVEGAPKTMVKEIVEILKNTQTGDYIYEYSR